MVQAAAISAGGAVRLYHAARTASLHCRVAMRPPVAWSPPEPLRVAVNGLRPDRQCSVYILVVLLSCSGLFTFSMRITDGALFCIINKVPGYQNQYKRRQKHSIVSPFLHKRWSVLPRHRTFIRFTVDSAMFGTIERLCFETREL